MIKLKPEHVGTRVLLSDGAVTLLRRFQPADEYIPFDTWVTGLHFFDESGVVPDVGEPRITLLLDAPNPLDVEVPEWCKRVVLWRGSEATATLNHLEARAFIRPRLPMKPITGWSPAPGQLPPREAA